MEFHFSHDSCTNTDLSTADRQVTYSITTPHTLKNRSTTIVVRRILGDEEYAPDAQDVARIDWHTLKTTEVTFHGQTMDEDRFLVKHGASRSFVGPDGRTYKWRTSWKTTQACHLDVEGGQPTSVATFHHKVNIFTGKKPTLVVDESVLGMLDLIIVSWIFIERDRRREEQQNAGGG